MKVQVQQQVWPDTLQKLQLLNQKEDFSKICLAATVCSALHWAPEVQGSVEMEPDSMSFKFT